MINKYMGAQPNDELTRVDCGQEFRNHSEFERIMYELRLEEIEEVLWKREVYRRGSEDLKNFFVLNVPIEGGVEEIRKKLIEEK
ncbi:uncharacterized protein VNE69_10039 [Vairimorpha necatrix]|uniref:Uncharacterized protein n=1 Tax=Vairimorpha necatrix TaxID=6039 RepID=A0AAX4JFD8_9MICR